MSTCAFGHESAGAGNNPTVSKATAGNDGSCKIPGAPKVAGSCRFSGGAAPLPYSRKTTCRAIETTLPFKGLEGLAAKRGSGAVEKTRTSTGVSPQRPQRCASTNSATTALFVMGSLWIAMDRFPWHEVPLLSRAMGRSEAHIWAVRQKGRGMSFHQKSERRADKSP